MSNHHKYVIIGAGPTGLGAAYRLKELGITDVAVFDRRSYAGGLASSFQDEKGFWWDIGGHVQFSHYTYFDTLMDMLLPNLWLKHERESWVWIMDRFVPYPFQLNIHRLPKDAMFDCLKGLVEIQKNHLNSPKNFAEWMVATNGKGIADLFLRPYNTKVWAYPPEEMNTQWVGERVAITDLTRVLKNVLNGTDDVSWGPNNTFRFPQQGGTGAIWKALGERVRDSLHLGEEVLHVNTANKTIRFAQGPDITYEYLITTMPLDIFCEHSDLPEVIKSTSRRLKHSTTHIVGIGLEGQPKEEIATKCWMYFPEDNCPFYRVTVFSKYSPHNVPDPKKYWSLMCEVAESPQRPVRQDQIIAEVIAGAKNTKLITDTDHIVSTWYHKELYGYPTPSVERNEILETVHPVLMERDILSRGRFGMWKYEVSNQDHSLMQGVEAANHLVFGSPELTAWYPNVVNGPKPYLGYQ